MERETIAAIATPIGVGGIGIIRISGSHAFALVSNIFVPKNTKLSSSNPQSTIDVRKVQSHKLYYGYIVVPAGKGDMIDEALVTFMKSPKTYTTEDIVEIQAHSGFITLNRLLSVVLENGAKMAEPGEFTKRAFLNGRIDLTQAEGIINLINAKTNRAATIAAKCVEGHTKSILERLRLSMYKIQADCEVMIEFEEQSCEKISRNDHHEVIKKQVLPNIERMIGDEKERIIYQNGVEIVIVGAPNVGKSSLMNSLLRSDRTIVTDIPGTTRNIIREHTTINGLPIVIYDTAGIHITSNAVEQVGISKAKSAMEKADMILLVIDASEYHQLNTTEKGILDKYNKKQIIMIVNKIDICTSKSLKIIEQDLLEYKIIKVSSKENLFIDKVRMVIFETFANCKKDHENKLGLMPFNSHQYFLLKETKSLLSELLGLMNKKVTVDIISYEIGKCIDMLGKILGTSGNGNLHDYIFDKFCIGK